MATPLTVKRALRLPALRVGSPEVVAGAAGLDRPIRWAHAGEVPNMPSLLKGGELLLTTGMGVGRSAAAQRAFIHALADGGAVGVVIELGGVYRDALPEPMARAAELRGLPLIALRREVPFVEVTEAIHTGIVGHQLAVLRRGDDLHRRFTELMVEGAGIPEVLATLAAAVADPVLLERADGEVLYHATYRTPPADVIAAWEAGEEGLAVAVPGEGGRPWGRLVALGLDSPLDDFDRVAVERAVALIALALLRDREEERLFGRERGNFLADVAAGRLAPAESAHRAAALGFAPGAAAMVPVAIVLRERDEAMAWRRLISALASRGTPGLLGTRTAADALLVIAVPRADRRVEAVEAVVAALPETAVVAAGAAVDGWGALPVELAEAAATAEAARAGPARAWHDTTVADLDRLLWRLRGREEVQAFVRRRLGPLLDGDDRRTAGLLPTLEALCELGGRKAETARVLHLERQSLYARLARIESVLAVDLDDPDTRLGLHLALRWRRHLEAAV